VTDLYLEDNYVNTNDRYTVRINPVELKKVTVRDGVARVESAAVIKGLEYDNVPIELVVQMEDLLAKAYGELTKLGQKYMEDSLKKGGNK
jgi:hypothetical protein